MKELELDLDHGRILGRVEKMPATGHFKISFPGGTLETEHAVYDLDSEGVVRVYKGKVLISVNKVSTGSWTLVEGQQFSAKTETVTPVFPAWFYYNQDRRFSSDPLFR